MSDTTNVQVTVTADLSGLKDTQAEAKNTKAAFDGLTVSAKDFAAALAAAGNDLSKVKVGVAASGEAARQASIDYRGLIDAQTRSSYGFKSAADSARVFEQALNPSPLSQLKTLMNDVEPAAAGAMHGTAGITRELIVLGGEVVRGNYTRLPGSLLVLTNRMNLLSLSTLGPVAGVAAVSAALAVLTIRAAEAEQSVARLQVAFQFAGLNDTNAQIARFAEDIHKLPGATQADAEEVVRGFTTMQDASSDEIRALSASVGEWATITGQTAKQAGESLQRAFQDPLTSGQSLFEKLQNVSDATRQEYEAAVRAGDGHRAAAAMLDALNQSMGRVQGAIVEQQTGWGNLIPQIGRYAAALLSDQSVEDADAQAVARTTHELQENTAARQAAVEAMRRQSTAQQELLRIGLEAGQREDPQRAELDRTKGDIAQIQAGLQAARATGNTVRVAQLNQDLAAAEEHLQRIGEGNYAQRQSQALDGLLVKVTQNARTTQQLEQEKDEATVRFYADAAKAQGITDQERNADLAKANEARLRLTELTIRTEVIGEKTAVAEKIAEYDRDIAAAKGNYAEVLQIEAAKLAYIKSVEGEKSKAYVEAEKAEIDIENQHAAETIRLEEEHLRRTEQTANQDLAAAKRVLDQKVTNEELTAAQREQILLQFTRKQQAAELAALDDFIKTLKVGTTAYQQEMDARAALAQKFADQDATLQAQIAQAEDAENKKRTQSYDQSFSQIGSSWNSTVKGLIEGTETWQKAELSVGGAVVDSFIQVAQKMVSEWLASAIARNIISDQSVARQVATEQAGGQSGFAAITRWAAQELGLTSSTEATKTAITGAANAQRVIVTNAAGVETITITAAQVPPHLAAEAAKTGATVAGVGSRVAAQTAGAAEGAAVQTAANTQSITQDAGRAAAGAYAAVAEIPIIGPILAPAAAAVAYGAVAAFESFDTGAWNLPRDQLALVHEGEMIIPAQPAQQWRNLLAGGGGGGAPSFTTPADFSGRIGSAVNDNSVGDISAIQHNHFYAGDGGGGGAKTMQRMLAQAHRQTISTIFQAARNGQLKPLQRL